MQRTQQDLTFFKNLSQTETGRHLMDYLKRVIDHAHDSRSWAEGDTKESAAHAARLIKEEVLEFIRNPDTKKSDKGYEFE